MIPRMDHVMLLFDRPVASRTLPNDATAVELAPRQAGYRHLHALVLAESLAIESIAEALIAGGRVGERLEWRPYHLLIQFTRLPRAGHVVDASRAEAGTDRDATLSTHARSIPIDDNVHGAVKGPEMPTKTDKTRHELNIEQDNAIDLLVLGQTDQVVAEAVGVTRQTVCTWRNRHPAFQAELNARRLDVWGGACDRLRALLPRALDALEAAVTGETPDWRAAAKVIELTGLDRQGYGIPNLGPYSIGSTNPDHFTPRGPLSDPERSFFASIDAIEQERDPLVTESRQLRGLRR